MRKLIFLLFTLLLFQGVNAQEPVQFVEPTAKQEINVMEYSIPFKKYMLDNGLTFIVNEDHSDQVVSIHLLFKIGSAASPADMNGMMNIISKVLFDNKQSEDYQFIQNYGGDYQYKLTQDYLSCLITVPKNIYKLVLWYQTQKLFNFQQNLTSDVFTAVRQKAIEEAYKSVGTPESQGLVKAIKGYYPFGHPYSWLPVGDPDKTELIELNDVKKFYDQWIGANNLIITLSGDLLSEDALETVKSYLGKLPKVPMTAETVNNAAFLAENPDMKNSEKQFFMNLFTENEDFKTPVLYLIYPGVAYSDPGRFAMEYASYLFDNNDYGLLYKSLVESKLAKEVSVKNYSFRSGGYFIVKIVADGQYPLTVFKDTVNYFVNNTFGQVEKGTIKRMKDEKKSIKEDGTVIEFNPAYSRLALGEELPVYKGKKLIELCSGAEATNKKCKILGFNELYYSNPNNISDEIKQLVNISPQRIQKLCHENLALSKPLVISVLNASQGKLSAGKENYSPQNLQTVILHPTDDEISKIQTIAFNVKKPKKSKISAYIPPKKEVNVLENGLKYSTFYHNETPVVQILIAIDISALQEQMPIPEVFNYFNVLMENRIISLQNGDLKEQLDLSGIKYRCFVQNKTFYLNLTLMNDNLQFIKEFIREYFWGQVRGPVDVEKISKIISDNRQRPELADYYNILKISTDPNTNRMLVPEFVEPNHKNSFYILQINEKLPFLLTPAKTTVTVTGNYRQGEIMDLREIFRQWQPLTFPGSEFLSADSMAQLKGTYFLTWKRQNNPKVFLKYASIPFKNYDEQIKMDFINYLMKTRLANKLSDKKYITELKPGVVFTGKTYDYCFTALIEEGSFILGLKELDAALFKPEISTIDKKLFKEYKNAFLLGDFVMYQNDFHKTILMNNMLSRDISSDFYAMKFKLLKKLKPSALQSFADKSVQSENKLLIIGGNREQHLDNIKNAGFSPLIEIDENGFPVKN